MTALSNTTLYDSIQRDGFSSPILALIDNLTNDILNGRTNFNRFNQPEHAGLCTAGASLIGAYVVCYHARASLATSPDAPTCQRTVPNWEIDARQEAWVQEWASAHNLWFDNPDRILTSVYGAQIAQGAEAKVYYKTGDPCVVKERVSIYATFGKALEAIVLHNSLFPETPMHVIGFTRDSDGLLRVILTQPYIGCERLATKAEIDAMVASKGFTDKADGNGVNYMSERLFLEDMHPANVFIDVITHEPICIDCIVKFR